MQPETISPSIIDQEQFEQYAAHWLSVVSETDNPVLAKSFLTSAEERVLHLSFPIQRIVELVSAVGVTQIKARFLLVPGPGEQACFTLALFATDAQQERLSAYYLPDSQWNAPAPRPVLGEQVPRELAGVWLTNWKTVPAITAALFTTSYGPLQGYNFDIKDFVMPLFTGQPFAQQEIRLGLGLHEYYAATPAAEGPTQTFGLVVRLHNPAQQGQSELDEPYFDMSTPCPPNI